MDLDMFYISLSTVRVALRWSPVGHGGRGRPRRRIVESEDGRILFKFYVLSNIKKRLPVN